MAFALPENEDQIKGAKRGVSRSQAAVCKGAVLGTGILICKCRARAAAPANRRVWLPAKRAGQQLPRRAARGGRVRPRTPRSRKPQVGAEAELWAVAPPPRAPLLTYPELVGTQKGHGGSQGAHKGPGMGGLK